MTAADKEALRNWARSVEAEAREFGVPYADAYHSNIQVDLQKEWDAASVFGRIGLWLAGDMPENAEWF